jgi:rhomboid protease GluP
MATLGRLLLAALGVCLRLGDLLGLRGARWEWKKQTWRQALENRIASWENLERGVKVRTRMCRECRTLVPRQDSKCPACGAPMSGVPAGGLGRLIGLMFPGSTTVSTLLIGANILMSAVLLLTWGIDESARGFTGLLSPPWQAYYLFGEKSVPEVFQGEAWRLVTANYLHGGVIHLLFNCFALTTLGPLVEQAFGARKFFTIYTVCGVAALLVSSLFSRSPAVGASGALFGLMGFAIVYGRFRGGSAGRLVSEQLLRWAMYGVFMLFMPGIDNLAHIGGFVTGGILGALVSPGEPRSRGGEIALRVVFAAAVLATLGSFAAMALTYGRHLEDLRQAGLLNR